MAKILVIDDDPAIIEILLGCLTADGHTVLAATDAYTGLAAAIREKPDLITLDFHMPMSDGGKAHERLRGNLNTARIPVIFVTGAEPDKLPPFARGDSGARFLPKPIDMERLRAFVAEILGVSYSPRPPAAAPADPPLDGGALGGDILDLDL